MDDINYKIRQKDLNTEENDKQELVTPKQNIINYHIQQDKETKKISILYSLSECATVTGIITDSKGVVYKKQSQSNNPGSNYVMDIDYNGLSYTNTFVVCIKANNQKFTEKFNK